MYSFILAAADGDLHQAKALMEQGVSPSAADYDKRTALMMAANQGHDVSGKLVCLCVGVGVCGCGKELESLVMCGFRGCGWLVRVCRWLAVPCLMSCCLVCCLAV